MPSTINKIKDLISQGKIKAAIEVSKELALLQGDTDFINEINILSSLFFRNQLQYNRGVITQEVFSLTTTNTTRSLLFILDSFHDPSVNLDTSDTVIEEEASPLPSKEKILFLASNPLNTGLLQLEKEHSRINASLQESDNFDVRLEKDINFSNFLQSIVQQKPSIIHFSGHGQSSTSEKVEISDIITRTLGKRPSNDTSDNQSGIILFNDSKRDRELVPTDVLDNFFKTMTSTLKIPINLVIFNACFSEEQAMVVAGHVPYVIGSSWAVGDEAAIGFSSQFYFGLANGLSIEESLAIGRLHAMQAGEPIDRFVLYKNGQKIDL